MKIIYDNIIYSKEPRGGISNYWFELSKRMLNSENELKFIEEARADENLFRQQLDLSGCKFLSHVKYPLLLSRILPIKLTTIAEASIYHSSFYRKISDKHLTEVTTVHDFTHDLYYPRLNRKLHNMLKYSAIKRSKGIICISQNTLKDLYRFCPIGKNQLIKVIYNGVSNDFHPIKNGDPGNLFKDEHKRKYLLYVGSRARHKNFDFLLEILKFMSQYSLVIVGSELSILERKIIDNQGLLNRVIIKTNVSNSDLNRLYNGAHALIFPSSYEGFGIPIAEAMRAGCPVIALNASSIPEVVGDAGLLVDELISSSFIHAIQMLENESIRCECIEKGLQNSKKYTWDHCYDEISSFYKEIAS